MDLLKDDSDRAHQNDTYLVSRFLTGLSINQRSYPLKRLVMHSYLLIRQEKFHRLLIISFSIPLRMSKCILKMDFHLSISDLHSSISDLQLSISDLHVFTYHLVADSLLEGMDFLNHLTR